MKFFLKRITFLLVLSAIRVESALCFADAFGTTPQFWINLQTNHDLWIAAKEHKKVKPLTMSA
jgi:plasmid maintenance system antidote protein VapI